MSWILIIIQLIAALPKIIEIVKEIIDFIKKLPKNEQGPAREKLLSLIQNIRANGMSTDSVAELHLFRNTMKYKAEKM